MLKYYSLNIKKYIQQKSYLKIIFITIAIMLIKMITPNQYHFTSSIVNSIYLIPVIVHSIRFSFLHTSITLVLNQISYILIASLFNEFSYLNFSGFLILQISAISAVKFAKYYYIAIDFYLKENKIYLDAITTLNYIKVDDKNINALLKSIENEYRRILNSDVTIVAANDKPANFIYNQLKDSNKLDNYDIKNAIKCWSKKKNIKSDNFLIFKRNWQWFILGNNIGIIGVKISKFELMINPKEKKLIYELINQAANVINRSIVYQKDSQAQEANYKLSMAILSSISHDLKTPLTSIIGSLSAIRYLEDKLTVEVRNSLIFEAEEEAVQLNRFISNLLDMIKLQSGKMQLQLEYYEPMQIIRNLLKRMQFKDKNHIKYIPQTNGQQFKLDAVLLEQVLQNILDNALKAAPYGSEIIIRSFIDENNYGCFTIEDQGPGIPISMRNQVFKKFFSVSHFESQTPGSGLGLAICNTIVEAHKGKVTIENNNNLKDSEHPGTIFTIFLPEAKSSDQQI